MEPETSNVTTHDPNPLRGGIACPSCGCPHHYVTHTIQSETKFWGKRKQYIQRRRVCRHCNLPFTTREVVVPELPDQVKSPKQAATVKAKIQETLGNIIPDLPPNPYV